MAEDLTNETETPKTEPKKQSKDTVLVTITKFGDGKVSTGDHKAGIGDIYAKRGDILEVAPEVASELEARALVEAD